MADDINKKIKIEVELETEKLQKNITALNKIIDGLFVKLQLLNAAGAQNSAAFENASSKLEIFQKRLQDVNNQITVNTTSLKQLNTNAKDLDSSLKSSASSQQKSSSATADAANKVQVLGEKLKSLDASVKQQVTNITKNESVVNQLDNSVVNLTVNISHLSNNFNQLNASLEAQGNAVDQNKSKFDAHKQVMDHLKKSFDEIKGVSGEFGPSLEEASKGFGVMKSGLKLIEDGFKGVGTAIKADGFDFLLQILQMLFDWFVKSSEGSKVLKGAISAIGVIVKDVSDFFKGLMDDVIKAFSHPIDSIKALGKIILENIINRFTAFKVILDGIIHLDFKKMANGAIQAFTGVTDATDKIANGAKAVVKAVKDKAGEMSEAYDKGYKDVGKTVDNHENKVIASLERQIKKYKELLAAAKTAHSEKDNNTGDSGTTTPGRGETLTATSAGVTPQKTNVGDVTLQSHDIRSTASTEEVKKAIKKAAIKDVEDYAKKSAKDLEKNGTKMLSDYIKKQAEAKVTALEKEKNAELANKNLTSAQRLAIENKYQKQEAAVKAKAFKQEQELSIAQAIINGAQAVTKVTAQAGVLAPFEIGIVVAETAAQIAKISAQKPPAMAKGGHFKSDGKGAVLSGYSRTDDTNAFLRSGEAVVVSEAMQVPWARNLVSAINVGFGGRDFSVPNTTRGYAVGGIFTDGGNANRYYSAPVNDQKNLANTIAYQMINNFPPVYVDVKDINNQQNILAQTINRVNL